MSLSEIAVLAFIISAFTAFSVTLAWVSRAPTAMTAPPRHATKGRVVRWRRVDQSGARPGRRV